MYKSVWGSARRTAGETAAAAGNRRSTVENDARQILDQLLSRSGSNSADTESSTTNGSEHHRRRNVSVLTRDSDGSDTVTPRRRSGRGSRDKEQVPKAESLRLLLYNRSTSLNAFLLQL